MSDAILSHPARTLLAALVATLAFGYAATGLRLDNTPETWLPSLGGALADYERFRERFGDDSLIVAFSDAARPADPAWRSDFAALAAQLRSVPGVDGVVEPEFGPHSEGSPLGRRLLGDAGRYVGLALFPAAALDAQERSRLVTRIERALDAAPERLDRLHLAGADVITHDLDLGSQRSLGTLSPLVFAIMCGVFYGATRSARAVGAMLAVVVASSLWTLGSIAVAGRTLNLVLVVIPAIVAVVTCAQATHLLWRFQSLAPGHPGPPAAALRRARWREAIEACWRPCLLSAVTTAAGFASLAVSEIAPVRDLGIFTATGVMFSFVLVFSVVPALLATSSQTRPRPHAARRWTPRRAGSLAAALRRRAPSIVATSLAATLALAVGIGRLQLESHILRFFPEDHRVPRNYADIEENLLGLTPVELELEGPRDALLSPATIQAFDTWVARVTVSEPLLAQVLSPLGSERAEALPPELRAARLRAALSEEGAGVPPELARYVSLGDDRAVVRTTLAARTSSSNACDALVRRLRASLGGAFPDPVAARITGAATLLIQGQVLLLDTQVRSFAAALLVITVLISVVFRSASAVAISLLPNLMPVASALGIMGLLRVPLDTATITVAGIALGLIVDDTIHFLYDYRRARAEGSDREQAVARTLFTVGRPILVTSVAVAAGFGAFALSPFRPTLYFGALIACTSVAACLCDLIVLPALLQLRRPGGRGRRAAAVALLAACGLTGCLGASAPPAEPVNLVNGVALHGYDPVAYFREGRPAPGDPRFQARRGIATYRFASAENRRLFLADPARYLPAYGGYCAFAVSVNRTADIDPRYWSISGGRLFLNNGRLAQTLWKLDEKGRIEAADRHWPRLVGRERSN